MYNDITCSTEHKHSDVRTLMHTYTFVGDDVFLFVRLSEMRL